jgi:hypothetical protein
MPGTVPKPGTPLKPGKIVTPSRGPGHAPAPEKPGNSPDLPETPMVNPDHDPDLPDHPGPPLSDPESPHG